jgi:hypothetical protein
MSNNKGDKKEGGILVAILVPTFIAIFAGGTAPWWWEKLPKYIPSPSPSSLSNESPKATIDLKQEQKVDWKQTVAGEIEGGLPSDQALYLYVRVPSLKEFSFYYFPVKLDGKIWNTAAQFGSKEDNSKFQTGLVLVNPKDPKFSNRNQDNGVHELVGKKLTAQITVQRK